MKDLAKYLEVPFDSKDISETELLAFSTDWIARATANSPVELSTRIAATTGALATVAQCSSDDSVRLGARKAAKMVKNDYRKITVPQAIEGIYIVVISKYGLNGPGVTEVFAKGRGIFTSCTDDKLQVELDALQAALVAKQDDLGPQVVVNVQTLKNNWTTIYAASEEKSGQKTTTEAGKRTARQNLQLELFFNLIELMKMFPRQPEKLALYMTQSLLEDHPAEEEPTPPGP